MLIRRAFNLFSNGDDSAAQIPEASEHLEELPEEAPFLSDANEGGLPDPPTKPVDVNEDGASQAESIKSPATNVEDPKPQDVAGANDAMAKPVEREGNCYW